MNLQELVRRESFEEVLLALKRMSRWDDGESVIKTSCRNRARLNRAKQMRDHRRDLLREKYERLF